MFCVCFAYVLRVNAHKMKLFIGAQYSVYGIKFILMCFLPLILSSIGVYWGKLSCSLKS